MKKSSSNKKFTYAVGRRKSASARVRLYKGDSDHIVNGVAIANYFPGETMRKIWSRPFTITNTFGKYFVTVKVAGGGKHSQLDAVVHGISRVLTGANSGKFRDGLKKAGLLTRDARVRERRKVGTGGKARRKRQSPKR